MLARRTFMAGAAGAALLAAAPRPQGKQAAFGGERLRDAVAALERESRGRLGVGLLDKANGARFGWRADERFGMASTFKFLAAAATLYRVDRGIERLGRRIPVRRSDIVAYSPAMEKRVGGSASIAELCEATIALSDNAAGNLLLPPLGGPAGLTRFLRAAGDPVTRLDRSEPRMNDVQGRDIRDTTTPMAMADDLDRFLLGDILRPQSRGLLLDWMASAVTGPRRIRAGVPADWLVAHKTGTSGGGGFNDVALLRPPGRAPLLLSIYLAETPLEGAAAEAILAGVTRAVVREA
jgi:beta-lactamase class A